jgi:hypothetical protein
MLKQMTECVVEVMARVAERSGELALRLNNMEPTEAQWHTLDAMPLKGEWLARNGWNLGRYVNIRPAHALRECRSSLMSIGTHDAVHDDAGTAARQGR